MTLSEEYLYPPEDIQSLEDPLAAQKIQYTFDVLFAQLRALTSALAEATAGGGGGSGPHDFLSATHTDTTAAAEVNGDSIIGQAGTWKRLAIGTNDSVLVATAGVPAWATAVPAGTLSHRLLSAVHSDTTAASPLLGDVVTAQGLSAFDPMTFWFEGGSFLELPLVDDPGSLTYWLDGGTALGLGTSSEAVWERKGAGAIGTVLTMTGTGPEWQSSSGAGGASAVAAYRSADFVLADLTLTAVTLQATTFDDGSFWSAAAPTRLTVPVSLGGTYVLVGLATWDSLYVGIAYAFLYVNGVLRASSPAAGVNATAPFLDPTVVSAIVKLNSGDYVELYVHHRANIAGTAGTIKGGASKTYLHMGRLVSESIVGTSLPSPVAGSIVGNTTSTAYERLAAGAATTVLLSDGSTPAWSSRAPLRDVAEAISGVWAFGNGLKERSRSFALGTWDPVTYAAGNFTASGVMTWTVLAADIVSNQYTLIGKTMIWDLSIAASTIAVAADAVLFVTLPNGLTTSAPAGAHLVNVAYFLNAGAVYLDARAQAWTATSIAIHRGGTAINLGGLEIRFTMIMAID